jgi:Hyaluronidase
MSRTKDLLRSARNVRALVLMLGCVASFTLSFSASAFTVYDQLLYLNKPDLRPYGLKNSPIFYESDLFPLGQYSQPNEAAVRAAARRLVESGHPTDEPVVLDVERWEWDTHYTTDAVATDSMNKLIQIIRWFRNAAPPYTKVGYYAAGPNRQYWPAQDPVASSPAFVKWQGSNDFLAPLIAEMGALYPSLYTFYNDRAGWVKYAKANIAEAKRIGGGKPIYPYIWPRYHEGGDMGQIYIDYEFWKLQLQTVKDAGATGVIIWGGYMPLQGAREEWTGSWPWWQATRDFLGKQATQRLNTSSLVVQQPTPTAPPSTPTTSFAATPATATNVVK